MQNLKVFTVLRKIITYIDLQVSKVLVKKSVLEESEKTPSKRRKGVLFLRNIFIVVAFIVGVFLLVPGENI